MGEAQTTICVQCKYHRNTMYNRGAPDVWYNHVCKHPELERPKGIDPVTGATVYWSQNDLDMTVAEDAPHPHCRDINDGHCSRFKAKLLRWGRR